MKPDFSNIAYEAPKPVTNREEWEAQVQRETGRSVKEWVTETMERIDVDPLYTREVYERMEHLDYTAGIEPFLRGPYATMYAFRPWTSANTRASPPPRNRTPSTAATSPPVSRAVGRLRPGHPPRLRFRSPARGRRCRQGGVAIDSIEDMQMLFDQHPARASRCR
jgi:methylmalonyl-CoA mutase